MLRHDRFGFCWRIFFSVVQSIRQSLGSEKMQAQIFKRIPAMRHFDINSKVKRKKWLEMLLGSNWNLEPAGGSTGEAFIAHDGSQKLFLKCNSSPFLAVLSAEGIVPKLLWTKRLANGDVITAQRYIEGRELGSKDMQLPEVAQLLRRIHTSKELLEMLKRIENQVHSPDVLLAKLRKKAIYQQHRVAPIYQQAFAYLEQNKAYIEHENFVVCHCDLNHNNWIVENNEALFLIDWDGASVADPALDLSIMLHWYVPRATWEEWLRDYGIELNDSLFRRMHWYITMHTLDYLLESDEDNDVLRSQWVEYLESLMVEDVFTD